MSKYMKGEPVSETEVAEDLGFGSVAELRKWETECGQKLADAEAKLAEANRDKASFLWHGKRMEAVLKRIYASLETGSLLHPDTRLAIGVVLGKEVDWGHNLDKWSPSPDKT